MLSLSRGAVRVTGRWCAASSRSFPRYFSSPVGLWHGGDSKFQIYSPLDDTTTLVYKEHLLSGSVVCCPLRKVDEWHTGALGPDREVRFKVDGGDLVKQQRTGEDWSEEMRVTRQGPGAGELMKLDGEKATPWWQNPMPNRLWTKAEVKRIFDESIRNPKEYKPQTAIDRGLINVVKEFLYKGFNKASGFDYLDPVPRACAWRLLFLESVAGVPGMVGASVRHFRSLRKLRRDYGRIHTLLEEAENERMHLLICLKMFNAGMATRAVIIGAQYVFTSLLFVTYIVRPSALHRFVGYLEECAVTTYAHMIQAIETDGTKLNHSWKHLPAPDIARTYYSLAPDAMWVDVLYCMLADEANHRDVNHAFADIGATDINPFIAKHHKDAYDAGMTSHEERKTL